MPSQAEFEDLNSHHAIAGIATIVPGEGGLPKIQIRTPAAHAEIYLHGAQITSWRPASHQEVLFLSQHSRFAEGYAIRGGIPICFPWFRAKSDNPKAPAHGLVRTKAWRLESITHQAETVVISLAVESDDSTRLLWPHDFHLVHRITVGSTLKMELIATNTTLETGQENAPASFRFEEALHTYNQVGNITQLAISGLDHIPYLDNRAANQLKLQSGDIHFTQATDSAYLNSPGTAEIHDFVLNRSIRLEKQGSLTTVVWNPWQQDAAKLADLGDDEWQQFACVEAANILSAAVTLHPGEQHILVATLHVAPAPTA